MTLHLRYDGLSREATLSALGLDSTSTDDDILQSVAEHFDISLHKLQSDSIIDRGENGIVIRPKAAYG